MKIGDLVQLKSGGPWMTVVHAPDPYGMIVCAWNSDGKPWECAYPEQALTLCEQAMTKKPLADPVAAHITW